MYKFKKFVEQLDNGIYAYHVTRRVNLESIKENGLKMSIPEDYGTDGDIEGVYLFKTLDDAKDALFQWMGIRIEEWEEENDEEYDEICLKVDIDGIEQYLIDSVDYEYISTIDIEPSRIVEILEI